MSLDYYLIWFLYFYWRKSRLISLLKLMHVLFLSDEALTAEFISYISSLLDILIITFISLMCQVQISKVISIIEFQLKLSVEIKQIILSPIAT